MAILIAAPGSGSGKTTLTLAILAALQRRGLRIQPFKVGPDYIDPLFHTAVAGVGSRNLDPVLTSEDYVQRCYRHHAYGKDGAVIEGVMGLFDGRVGESEHWGSSAHVAQLLQIPVVLVINAAGMGQSVAALVHGFRSYDPQLRLAGVILNQVRSERHAQILEEALRAVQVPVLGMVHGDPRFTLPSRHLGLVPVAELPEFTKLIPQLAEQADKSLDWETLLPLIQEVPSTKDPLWAVPPLALPQPLRIAVAQDLAFCFYYADNLDLLQHLGAEVVPYSPLQQGLWPSEDCQGLWLGGGFPEMFAAQLAETIQTRKPSQRDLIIYAECGGLMVLGQSLQDLEGTDHRMAGRFPFIAKMHSHLTLGYRTAHVLHSSPVVEAGQMLQGHEFHRSQIQPFSPFSSPTFTSIYTWRSSQEGWTSSSIHASYLHLHWGASPKLGTRFLQSCNASSSDQAKTFC
ncbi:MAG: cobyrinate a,c-diamide synthase [Synechococcaceae cyanobacterium SM2_3_1]|nr:cobyrinate a,c-diamide synthase [Synechococcaceae cyanobacterium SM2_3_1]